LKGVQWEATGPESDSNCITFSPNGQAVAVCNDDGTAWIYDLRRTESPIRTFPQSSEAKNNPEECFYDCRFNVNGDTLFTGGVTNRIVGWDTISGLEKEVFQYPGTKTFKCSSLSMTPDGQLLCAGFWDGGLFFCPIKQ